jgi:hypothetical protein
MYNPPLIASAIKLAAGLRRLARGEQLKARELGIAVVGCGGTT